MAEEKFSGPKKVHAHEAAAKGKLRPIFAVFTHTQSCLAELAVTRVQAGQLLAACVSLLADV